MEYSLSEQRLEEVWVALSDVFVDNEINYDWIAKKVIDVDPVMLEQIFFEDVAPHCSANLMTVIPPIWQGFDKERLATGIREMKSKNKKSIISNLQHKAFVKYFRFCFREEWRIIESKLVEHKSAREK
jgi:hypothetical protein